MFLVTPEQIGAVMALEPTPRSFAELDEQVAHGLPSAALKALIERVSLRPDERNALLHRIVPKSTLVRRSAHLSSGESEKTERLARAFATALSRLGLGRRGACVHARATPDAARSHAY
jgi:uncharacterized protein (DUF2384 family)